MDKPLLGIEIGGTKLQVVVGNDSAAIADRRRFNVRREEGAEGIRNQIVSAIREFGHGFGAVGVGFGGPVDWRTGRIACSHHVPGWSDFDMRGWLADLTGAPVRVDNDANTAAVAEALRGAGRALNPVFYVTLGSGVGGGLVLEGQIYHGAIPGEAEIGHVRLDRSGTILEDRCSGWAVDRKIRAAISEDKKSVLANLVGEVAGGEARALGSALKQNCSVAARILDEVGEDLAFGLSHVTHLCHPQVIVLGGGLSLIGEPLRQTVEKHLARFVMDAFSPGPQIRIAALGEDVVPIGALILAEQVRTVHA